MRLIIINLFIKTQNILNRPILGILQFESFFGNSYETARGANRIMAYLKAYALLEFFGRDEALTKTIHTFFLLDEGWAEKDYCPGYSALPLINLTIATATELLRSQCGKEYKNIVPSPGKKA